MEIKTLKTHLMRLGLTEDTELMLLIFYKGQSESQRIKVKLGRLDRLLFDAESNPNVTSIFLFDSEVKRPYWRLQAHQHTGSLEVIPSSGHPSIVRDFGNMSQEKRDTWVDITVASIQQYTSANEV